MSSHTEAKVERRDDRLDSADKFRDRLAPSVESMRRRSGSESSDRAKAPIKRAPELRDEDTDFTTRPLRIVARVA